MPVPCCSISVLYMSVCSVHTWSPVLSLGFGGAHALHMDWLFF